MKSVKIDKEMKNKDKKRHLQTNRAIGNLGYWATFTRNLAQARGKETMGQVEQKTNGTRGPLYNRTSGQVDKWTKGQKAKG
jgi:hypothetical protein